MSDIEKTTAASETEASKPAKDAKEEVKKASKKDKPALKERVAKAWREYKSELKKIVWYNREQTFRSSVVVVVSIIIVSACVGGLDWVFSKLLMWLGSLV